MRIRMDLSYDGAGFHGWARQPGLRTVEEDLEIALDTVLRRPGHRLIVAGRTDTGVNARHQVAHIEIDDIDLDTRGCQVLRRQLNGVLQKDVRIHLIAPAPAGFDARFSAIWRRYCYRIADRPESVDPLTRGQVLTLPRALDEAAMNEAAQFLLGEHDFASFCKKRAGATTIRTLLDLHWDRREDGVLEATVRADAFCHNMVRALIGCMVAAGEGRRDPAWAGEVLVDRKRHPAVIVMRPHGLTLEEVAYPPPEEMAARARAHASRRLRTLEEQE